MPRFLCAALGAILILGLAGPARAGEIQTYNRMDADATFGCGDWTTGATCTVVDGAALPAAGTIRAVHLRHSASTASAAVSVKLFEEVGASTFKVVAALPPVTVDAGPAGVADLTGLALPATAGQLVGVTVSQPEATALAQRMKFAGFVQAGATSPAKDGDLPVSSTEVSGFERLSGYHALLATDVEVEGAAPSPSPSPSPSPTPEAQPTIEEHLVESMLEEQLVDSIHQDLADVRLGEHLAQTGAIAEHLSVPTEGTLVLEWLVPHIVTSRSAAHPSRAKVRIARGAKAAAGAGSVTVRVKLTRKGKRLVRRSKKLRVTVAARFVGTDGTVVTARRAVKLHR